MFISGLFHINKKVLSVFIFVFLILFLVGCASDSKTAEGAGRGAATGAVSGAVGGMVSALVFGGDPAEAAARGAVYGGATGAVVGGIAGSQADAQAEKQAEAQTKKQSDEKLAKLRADIGDDAYEGLAALAECKHDKSLSQAAKAQESDNPNFSLAGLWLEVLSYADGRDEAKARSMFPTLVEKDWNIKTEAEAEERMRSALQGLMDIRSEYNLPKVCGG